MHFLHESLCYGISACIAYNAVDTAVRTKRRAAALIYPFGYLIGGEDLTAVETPAGLALPELFPVVYEKENEWIVALNDRDGNPFSVSQFAGRNR